MKEAGSRNRQGFFFEEIQNVTLMFGYAHAEAGSTMESHSGPRWTMDQLGRS